MIDLVKKNTNTRNPLFQFFLFLVLFTSISLFDYYISSDTKTRFLLFRSLFFAMLSFWGIFYIIYKKTSLPQGNPYNFAVTTLLTFLIIDPVNGVIGIPLALLFASISKLYRFKGQPIFNPTGAGILGAYLGVTIMSFVGLEKPLLVSWWGADMVQSFARNIPLLSVLLPALFLFLFFYFALQFRKGFYIAGFFMSAMFFIFLYDVSHFLGAAHSLDYMKAAIFNSFAFLTLVMIPEPKTSPVFPVQQLVVGICGGALFFFFTRLSAGLPLITSSLPFISTLLGMNILTYVTKRYELFR